MWIFLRYLKRNAATGIMSDTTINTGGNEGTNGFAITVYSNGSP